LHLLSEAEIFNIVLAGYILVVKGEPCLLWGPQARYVSLQALAFAGYL
jgi:hypothetical protein